MKTPVAAALLLALSLTAAQAQDADESVVYKWIDRDGVPHYTDRPPNEANATVTEIRTHRTDRAALQARAQREADLRAARNTRRKQAADEAAEAEKDREKTVEERQSNCEKARERAELYETSRRLYKPLPNGEREYLSDEELDKARADARAAVREWCNQK